MEKQDLQEREFYRGEYLGSFANHLVIERYGALRRNKGTYTFQFSHRNLDKLKVRVSQADTGLFNTMSCDLTLRGPQDQIDEFIRAAGQHLDNGIHSRKCIEDQLKEGD